MCPALVKVVTKFRLPCNEGNFGPICVIVSLSSWILLHGVHYVFSAYWSNVELNSTTFHAIPDPKSSLNPHGVLQGFILVITKPILSCVLYYNVKIRGFPKSKYRSES